MKLIKTKISVDKRGGSTKYNYPKDYRSSIISPMQYGGTFREGDNFFTYTIGYVKDDELSTFVGKPDMEEVSKDDAVTLAHEWIDKESKTDEEKVTGKENFIKKLNEII